MTGRFCYLFAAKQMEFREIGVGTGIAELNLITGPEVESSRSPNFPSGPEISNWRR